MRVCHIRGHKGNSQRVKGKRNMRVCSPSMTAPLAPYQWTICGSASGAVFHDNAL